MLMTHWLKIFPLVHFTDLVDMYCTYVRTCSCLLLVLLLNCIVHLKSGNISICVQLGPNVYVGAGVTIHAGARVKEAIILDRAEIQVKPKPCNSYHWPLILYKALYFGKAYCNRNISF